MTNLSGSRIILESLKRWGVKYVFGSMGEELAPFFDEVYRNRSIKFFDTRHEASAVFTAVGYSWVSGEPAVCTGTVGPGVANMFNGMFVASKQSVPIIGIVPKHAPGIHESIGFKSFDQTGAYRYLTKWSVDCDKLEQLPLVIDRAFRTATSQPQGPVMVSVNELLFEEEMTVPKKWLTRNRAMVINQTFDASEMKRATKLLREAETPVMLADARVLWNNAHPELERLANMLSIPVLSATRAIRPLIPETNQLNFGLYEPRAAPPSLELMKEADLLIAVDCYFDSFLATGEIVPENFYKEHRFPERIIQIDSDPSLVGKNYPAEVGLVGNSKLVLRTLIKELAKTPVSSQKIESRRNRARKLKNGWTDFIDREYRRLRNRKPINPLVLARELNRAVPKDCLLSVSGAFNSVFFHVLGVFTCEVPGSILGIGSDGSLGSGLCKAMGAKLAAPERPVVAFLGDGEFWYGNASELETLARTGVPVVVVISNNGCFGSDKYRQLKAFDGRFIGVDFSNPDFAQLGKVFGLHGERVEEPDNIASAIKTALALGKPALIDVVTALEPPPTFPAGVPPV